MEKVRGKSQREFPEDFKTYLTLYFKVIFVASKMGTFFGDMDKLYEF